MAANIQHEHHHFLASDYFRVFYSQMIDPEYNFIYDFVLI